MIYVFGDFTLDDRLYTLRQAGELLKLEPKVLDVLLYLIQHRERVITKDELIQQLWPGQIVGEAALTHCVAKVRKAVLDDGGKQQVIKTQHGRGYRFVAEVIEKDETILPLAQQNGVPPEPEVPTSPTERRATLHPLPAPSPLESRTDGQPGVGALRQWPVPWYVAGAGLFLLLPVVLFMMYWLIGDLFRGASVIPPGQPATSAHIPTILTKPTLAVLPFVNLSGDREQDYFSDGLTEDLITGLSRVSGLFVSARNAVFFYKGQTVKPEQVGRELGVRYVVEGSVRKADGRVRISAQLIDTTTSYHLWAEHYDRPLQDVFALQDDITQNIVAALAVKLKEGERARGMHRQTNNVEAYDLFARGWEYHYRFTRDTNAQAQQLFTQALVLDANYGMAYVGLGRTYCIDWFFAWREEPDLIERAGQLAQKVLTMDETFPAAHTLMSDVYLLQKRHDRAILEAQRAITLDPSFGYSYATLAAALNYAGRPEEAVSLLVEKAMRLDPQEAPYYATYLGHSYFLLRRYTEAVTALKRTLTRNPDFPPAHGMLASVYSELGRSQEARAEIAEVQRLSPRTSLERLQRVIPYKEQADLDRHITALQRAGLR